MRYEAVESILANLNMDDVKYLCFLTTLDINYPNQFEYSRYNDSYRDYGYKRDKKLFDDIEWNPVVVCIRIRNTFEYIDVDKIVAIKYRLFEEDE